MDENAIERLRIGKPFEKHLHERLQTESERWGYLIASLELNDSDVLRMAVQDCVNALHESTTVASELRSALGEAPNESRCGGCGGPHPFDTSVPSVLWNRVVRARNLSDFLCTTCIVKAFAEAGEGFTAELSGDGFSFLPIEVVINGETAKTVTLLEEENTNLRIKLRALDETAVDEFCRPLTEAPAPDLDADDEAEIAQLVVGARRWVRDELAQERPEAADAMLVGMLADTVEQLSRRLRAGPAVGS